MSELKILPGDEAAKRLLEGDGSDLFVLLGDFPEQFGLTREELLAELQAGRLVASGTPTDNGYTDVAISFKSITHWLVEASPAALKANAFLGRTSIKH